MYNHHHIVIAATVAVRPASNAALPTFVAPHAQHSLRNWMGKLLGTVAVHGFEMTLQVMLAGKGMSTIALRTHKRLRPVWVVCLHVGLQIMLARGH